jgi:hypothetical protein
MTDARRLRILAVVDDYTRECLALVALISGVRVSFSYGCTTVLTASKFTAMCKALITPQSTLLCVFGPNLTSIAISLKTDYRGTVNLISLLPVKIET